MIGHNYDWIYNFEDKLVHAAKRKSKNSECNIFIEKGITMPMTDMKAEILKKLCPICKDLVMVMIVIES